MKKVKEVAKEIASSKRGQAVIRPAAKMSKRGKEVAKEVLRPVAKMGEEMVDTVDRTVRGRKSPSHPFHGIPHGQYKKASVKKHFMRGLRRSDVAQLVKKIKSNKKTKKQVSNNALVKDLNLSKKTKKKITNFISKIKGTGRKIDRAVVDEFYKNQPYGRKGSSAYGIGRHADKIVAGAAGSAAAGSYTKKKLKNRKKSKGGK